MSAVIEGRIEPAHQPTSAQRAHRRRVLFVRWLRKIHLYVGLWGAMLGFVFGATGILMNHRAILKIPVEKAVQKSAQLALPEAAPRFDKPEEMARWLQAELKLESLGLRSKAEPSRKVTWADREVQQPARWSFNFNSPHKSVNAEYFVGNRYVKVETQDATPLGLLMRLHASTGVTVFWVLLADTIGAGMVVLSVTGLLLWSRLNPIRLSTVAVSLSALGAGVWFVWATA